MSGTEGACPNGPDHEGCMTNPVLQLIGRTTFIVGSGKNAGKTTFLNYTLKNLRMLTTPFFMSIGVDGEQTDQIFGTNKPRIFAEHGDYVVTTDLALKHADLSCEIHEVFPFQTVMGRPVLARVTSGGYVEVIGPENNTQVAEILASIKAVNGEKTILIDGAVNRITQVAAFEGAQFVFVVRVEQNRLSMIIDNIRLIGLFKDIERAPSILNAEKTFVCEGALTKTKLQKIGSEVKAIVIDDFTKVFLNWREMNLLLKKYEIYCRNRFDLAFIVVNLFDVSRETFMKTLDDDNLAKQIVFNPYEQRGLH